MMKKIFTLLLLTLTLNAFANKIGFVNIDKILAESKSFNQAQQIILQDFKKRDDALKTRAENLQKLLVEFKTIEQDLSENEKQAKLTTIAKEDKELKADALKLQKQFDLRRAEELQKFQDQVNEVLNNFAKQQKFDLILYKDVAYASNKIDITDKIATLLTK
jgi:outer membrane protein